MVRVRCIVDLQLGIYAPSSIGGSDLYSTLADSSVVNNRVVFIGTIDLHDN